MIVSHIVAHSTNRVIGRHNSMPWHIPGDLQHFKKLTTGKPVVVGRKTFASLPNTLPGRTLYVITRQNIDDYQNVHFVSSFAAAFQECADAPEICIAGGGQIYETTFPILDRIYLTEIDVELDGTVYYPAYDRQQFVQTSLQEVSTSNPPYRFITYERRVRPQGKYVDAYLLSPELPPQIHELLAETARHITEQSSTEETSIQAVLRLLQYKSVETLPQHDRLHKEKIESTLVRYKNIPLLSSRMLVALLRLLGVPAGFCYAAGEADTCPRTHSAAPCCIAAYVHTSRSWVILDAPSDVEYGTNTDSLYYVSDTLNL